MVNREQSDILVIGGGVNGCAVARDAAGRGYKVCLCEMDDLASGTSSASTKLLHGGLRYLEYLEFGLVRESLKEREILLKNMPHISWPMRFVLPLDPKMRFDASTPVSKAFGVLMPWRKNTRPNWLIRTGLFIYDHLGGRKILQPTKAIDLRSSEEGRALKDEFQTGYEYSDCWVQDSRLVSLMARDASERGADIQIQTKVISAEVEHGDWKIELQDQETGKTRILFAKTVVNAGGPWVRKILSDVYPIERKADVRLVKGSHIVIKKQYDHEKCYFFQGQDGRIIFAIPYEGDFTLIGTTDIEHDKADRAPECSEEEVEYLVNFVNHYFMTPITVADVVWKYSGVRPLYDDGASSATAATREYVINLERRDKAPILTIYGGKITTHRRLAKEVLDKIDQEFGYKRMDWTRDAKLPGGEFEVGQEEKIIQEICRKYPFLTLGMVIRLFRAYGLDTYKILGNSRDLGDLGVCFGSDLYELEVRWLMQNEFARTAEDLLWRRSKIGLRVNEKEIQVLNKWMKQKLAEAA